MAVIQSNFGNTGADTPASTQATLPSGTTAGTQLLIIVSADATVSTPAGFSLDRSQVNNNGHYHFRKTATGGETAWTITPSVAAAVAWIVLEMSALDSSPLDQVASEGAGFGVSSRGTGTTPATTQPNEVLVGSIGLSIGSGGSNSVNAWSDSFVELHDTCTTKVSGTNVAVAVALRTVSATGTYTSTATLAGVSAATGIITTYKATTDTVIAVAQAIEVDTAPSVAIARAVPVDIAAETDSAPPVMVARAVPTGLASEADTAQGVAVAKGLVLAQAVELDTAQDIARARAVPVSLAVEIDSALPVTIGGAPLIPGQHVASSTMTNLAASAAVAGLEAS